jgi:hypothetical protein
VNKGAYFYPSMADFSKYPKENVEKNSRALCWGIVREFF